VKEAVEIAGGDEDTKIERDVIRRGSWPWMNRGASSK
jgi:hypothetical protein